jgi:hypothetical protein
MFAEAKQDCDSALRLEPANKKAFYRRAMANKGLKVKGQVLGVHTTSLRVWPPIWVDYFCRQVLKRPPGLFLILFLHIYICVYVCVPIPRTTWRAALTYRRCYSRIPT